MNMSQGSLKSSMLEAQELLSQGSFRRAKEVLEAASQSQAHDDPEDLLDSACMRASIAAMEGADQAVLSQALRGTCASGTSEENLIHAYLEGVSALSRGGARLQSAKLKFDEVLRMDESFVLANLGLATVHHQQKRYAESFSQFRIVLESLGNAAPPVTRIGLALCAYRLGDSALSWKCTERALEVNPKDFLAKLIQVVLLLEARNIPSLAKIIQDLRRLVPNHVVVMQRVVDMAYLKAVSQRQLRNACASLRHVIDAILKTPDLTPQQEAYSRFQRGRLHHGSGELEMAKSEFEQCLEVMPTLTACSVHLSKVYFRLGDTNQAVHILKSLDATRPAEKEVLEMLAAHAAQAGQHELAMEYSRRLVELAPGESSSWTLSSWCYRLDRAVAATHLKKSFSLYHGAPVPWELRANYAALNPDTTAEELESIASERLDDVGSSESDTRRDAAVVLFNIALRLETIDADRARAIYTKILKADLHLPEVYVRLYELAIKQKQFHQALRWMALLHEVDTSALPIVYEARTFAALGAYGTAAAVLAGSKTTQSRNVLLALASGSIYLWCAQQTSRKASKQLDYALNRYQYVLARDPSNLLAAHGMACSLGILGATTEAHLCLDRIYELQPNDAYTSEGIAQHIANIRVMCDAFHPSVHALESFPSKTAGQYSALAFCYAGNNNFEAAIRAIEAGLRAYPQSPVLTYNAVLVYCGGVMHSMMRNTSSTGISDSEASKLRNWMVSGLQHAQHFTLNKPATSFEGYQAASLFVRHVARHTYSLQERLSRLQEVGMNERHRMVRDADLWKAKHAEWKHEVEERERVAAEAKHKEESLLAETYATLHERTATLKNPHPENPPELFASRNIAGDFADFDDEPQRRDRAEDDAATFADLEYAATLAVGGMRVDDVQPPDDEP